MDRSLPPNQHRDADASLRPIYNGDNGSPAVLLSQMLLVKQKLGLKISLAIATRSISSRPDTSYSAVSTRASRHIYSSCATPLTTSFGRHGEALPRRSPANSSSRHQQHPGLHRQVQLPGLQLVIDPVPFPKQLRHVFLQQEELPRVESLQQRVERLQTSLAAVGRMALTNYLLQSIVCITLFYGHGLGWYGSVERTGQAMVVLAMSIAQLFWSPLWLSTFHYGPFEWLWRSLTYWRLQPMRRGG